MPDILDVFNQDAYNVVSLSAAIDKAPYQPKRLGSMNLFRTKGVSTKTVSIEERHNTLQLIPTAARGTHPEYNTDPDRNVKDFRVPHLPHDDSLLADDVDGVRAFGTDSQREAIASKVNDKLEGLRNDHELTWEYHRVGAIKGVVVDADGSSTVYDWFTEFGIVKKTVTITAATTDSPRLKAMEVKRHIKRALGADTMNGIHVMCGETFWDNFTTAAGVKEAYDRWQDGAFLRETQAFDSFKLFNMTWEEYDGQIGGRNFIDRDSGGMTYVTDVAYAFPTGTQNTFWRFNAPAPFLETVNTVGRDLYVKQVRNKWGTGIEITSNSNPLFMCARPAVLVEILIV